MQMQPLIVPTPGRGDVKVPFENDDIQAGPSQTCSDRQSGWPGTNDDNFTGL
jgi:hypothetical protein